LAQLAREQGRQAEADVLLQRALAIQEQHLGAEHPETARTLHDLARLRQQQGRLVEACALAERALTIRQHAVGTEHRETVETQVLYAQLLAVPATDQGHRTAAPDGAEGRDSGSEEDLAARASAPIAADHPLHGFLEACCELHPRAAVRSADLWHAYQRWAMDQRERYPLPRGAFIARLKALGYHPDRTKLARIWRGIGLVPPKPPTR
jgi:hypothetical protein